MKIIDKLAWIEIKDQSILLTKSFGKDKYYIPGGKRENGESDEQALVREIKEELSVDLKSDTLEFVGIFQAQAHGQPIGTIVQMTCYMADFTGELKVDNEIEDIKWLNYADKDKIAEVDKLIFDYLKEKGVLV
jgi:8-oxo-dGTP pyrophosphatase MutT (NUDIX family)